jgi:hypothetical protein
VKIHSDFVFGIPDLDHDKEKFSILVNKIAARRRDHVGYGLRNGDWGRSLGLGDVFATKT